MAEKDNFLTKSKGTIKKTTTDLMDGIWKGNTKESSKTIHMPEIDIGEIKFDITGNPSFGEITFTLKENQVIYAGSGSLIWMEGNILVDSDIKGGIFSGIKRVFSGETLFQNAYYVVKGTGKVSLSPAYPGDILTIETEKNRDWIFTRNSFLCSTDNINITSTWQGLKSIFGRGYSILSRAETFGKGIIWMGIFGHSRKHELKEGEQLIVDGVNLTAFQAGMEYDIATGGNMKFFIFGGSGFVFKFKGPGIVYTQSRSIENFKRMIDTRIDIKRLFSSL